MSEIIKFATLAIGSFLLAGIFYKLVSYIVINFFKKIPVQFKELYDSRNDHEIRLTKLETSKEEKKSRDESQD